MTGKPTDAARATLVRKIEQNRESVLFVKDRINKLEAQLLHAKQEVRNLDADTDSCFKAIEILDHTMHFPVEELKDPECNCLTEKEDDERCPYHGVGGPRK